MKLKFLGATETVTGSRHLLITTKGKKILLDCGLYQQKGSDNYTLNQNLGFEPEEIEALILSHAHIDHSGNIPFLFRQGFRGKVYCTPPTFDVCQVLLQDSAHIQESDVRYLNKKRALKNLEPLKPLYTIHDAERCLKNFRTIPYNTPFSLNDEVEFMYSDVGHILGSAAVNLTLNDGGKKTHLAFSGDVGRYNDLLLKAPDKFPQADYIICESTYGDRLHEQTEEAEIKLLNIVRRTCVEKKGKLIIPAFSLGRTQEIVFSLDKMQNAGFLPNIKVYVDSPLSTNATAIMRKYVDYLNKDLHEYVKKDPDPFGFNNLHYISKVEESIKLNTSNEPCIIISASGMMDAGRIKHHLKHNISSQKNTILIVGYCAPNTLGGDLLEGKKEVRIFGNYFPVYAEVEVIPSYSAHADYSELIKFLSCQDKEKVKNIFLVHGEAKAKTSFREKLRSEGYSQVTIPAKGEIFELS